MICPKLISPHEPEFKRPKSKRVTLIAAARTPEGIVIHADSQETAGAYRVQVDKIKCETMGGFDVLIAGAGCPSALVDAFPGRLARRIDDKVTTLAQFARTTEKELVRFYKNDIELCPDENKTVIYVIAAWHSKTRQYQAWVAENVFLQPIPTDGPALIGWDHELYLGIAKRFYLRAMSVPQTVLAGIYLLTVAEDTCNYIKGPVHIAVVNEGGIALEDSGYVRRVQDRLRDYEGRVNQVFLDCTDTTISLPALEDSINRFRQSALALHQDHIDELAKKASPLDFARGNPFRELPSVPMRMLDTGGFVVEHDREAIARNDAGREENAKWVEQHGIEFLKKTVQCSKCQHEFEAEMPCRGPHGHSLTMSCPHCNEMQIVRWQAP